jgi:hypothetical protein
VAPAAAQASEEDAAFIFEEAAAAVSICTFVRFTITKVQILTEKY